jgi:hypothetical protein
VRTWFSSASGRDLGRNGAIGRLLAGYKKGAGTQGPRRREAAYGSGVRRSRGAGRCGGRRGARSFPKKLARQPSQGLRRLQVREVTGMPDHREPRSGTNAATCRVAVTKPFVKFSKLVLGPVQRSYSDCNDPSRSAEFVQKPLRLFEVRRVEAFGERAKDRV